MSSINVSKIKELAQKKINALTDASSLNDLENLMKISMLSGGGHLSVDSDGALPSSGKVAFDNQYDRLFLNKKAPNYTNTNWEPLQAGKTSTITPYASFIANFGSSYGYANGGQSPPNQYISTIERWSLASDGNSTDNGDLNSILYNAGSSASSTDGYHYGGDTNPATATITDVIRKYPFTADTSSTNVATLSRRARGLQSSTLGSPTHGYRAGGNDPASPPAAAGLNIIEKFIFASDGDGTDVGDLQRTKYHLSVSNSTTHGYVAGGIDVDPSASPVVVYPLTIDKWAFASDGNATDVGDITRAIYGGGGNSSSTHGYMTGGFGPTVPGRSADIEKYSFSSDGNSAQAGDLTAGRDLPASTNSPTSGYTAGGIIAPTKTNVIDKFPYADDGNATDVGDLTSATSTSSGNQY